jgi:AcrR family transcriptional regulator
VSRRRAEILAAATERFGQDSYEHTKWGHIAADVGLGATALYHYFESKQHCLYVIMDEAIADFHRRFIAATTRERNPVLALEQVLAGCFDLSDHEVLRNRVLVAEQGRLSSRSTSEPEEQARQATRSRMRELEFEWASFLAGAMREAAIPETDPRLLTRAVLGLLNSVWHWYRPNGMIALERVAEFYTARAMAIIGLPPGVHRPAQLAA